MNSSPYRRMGSSDPLVLSPGVSGRLRLILNDLWQKNLCFCRQSFQVVAGEGERQARDNDAVMGVESRVETVSLASPSLWRGHFVENLCVYVTC